METFEYNILTPGIVLFKNVVSISSDEIDWVFNAASLAFRDHYTYLYDSSGNIEYYVNQSDHKVPASVITSLPIRVNKDLPKPTTASINDALYVALIQYCLLYPEIIPSLWWQNLGHFAVYKEGSNLGLHSDNDVNYRPRTSPKDQSALHHVLSATIIINDSYDGGGLYFPHLGIRCDPGKGDAVLFPANFIFAHSVEQVKGGTRASYVTWFGHGSSNPDVNLVIDEAENGYLESGKVWLYDLPEDIRQWCRLHNLSEPEVLRRIHDH